MPNRINSEILSYRSEEVLAAFQAHVQRELGEEFSSQEQLVTRINDLDDDKVFRIYETWHEWTVRFGKTRAYAYNRFTRDLRRLLCSNSLFAPDRLENPTLFLPFYIPAEIFQTIRPLLLIGEEDIFLQLEDIVNEDGTKASLKIFEGYTKNLATQDRNEYWSFAFQILQQIPFSYLAYGLTDIDFDKNIEECWQKTWHNLSIDLYPEFPSEKEKAHAFMNAYMSGHTDIRINGCEICLRDLWFRFIHHYKTIQLLSDHNINPSEMSPVQIMTFLRGLLHSETDEYALFENLNPIIRKTISQPTPENFFKIQNLSWEAKKAFVTACFENAEMINSMSLNQKEKALDLMARIVGANSFTPECDALLSEIYEKYATSTDRNLVPFFRVLHRRTRTPEVIEKELGCHLFSCWGLRSVALQSDYTQRIIKRASEKPDWAKVNLGRIPTKSGLYGTALRLDMIQTGYMRYGGPLLIQAAGYVYIADQEHEALDLSEISNEYLGNMYRAFETYDVIKQNQYTHQLAADINLLESSRSHAGAAYTYFYYVYGKHYRFSFDDTQKCFAECADDMMIKEFGKFGSTLREIRKDSFQDQTEFNTASAEIYTERKECRYPETLEEQHTMFLELMKDKDVALNFIRNAFKDIIPFVGAPSDRYFFPNPLTNLARLLVQHTLTGESLAVLPLDYYKGDLSVKREIALQMLQLIVVNENYTYDYFLQRIKNGTWEPHINQKKHFIVTGREGWPECCVCGLKELLAAVGLMPQEGQVFPQWTREQLQTFKTMGVSGSPEPDIIDASAIESDAVLPVLQSMSFEALEPVEVIKLLRHIIKVELGIRRAEGLEACKSLSSTEMRSYSAHDFPFIKKNAELRVSLKQLMTMFRTQLAMKKMGIKNSDSLSAKQVISIISHAELVESLQLAVFNIRSLSHATEEDILDLVDQAGMREVLAAVGDDATDVAEYLQLFHTELVERYGLDVLVQSFIGLSVNADEITLRLRHSSPPREEALTEAILRDLADGKDVSEEVLQQIELIYRRILRRWAEQDAEAVLTWLSQRVDQLGNPHLETVFTRLFDYFGAYLNFQYPETITAQERVYQVEGVRFFSQPDHKRGLLADEPGMGKSVQAIGVVESTGVKKILWVTTNSNKQTIRNEILTHTTHADAAIKVLESRRLAADLRSLEGAKYLVINYEALRQLKTKDPEGYALLTKDLDMIILDEGQVADNDASQQGQAVQELAKEVDRFLILSATPIQNRFERLYNQLMLIDSERFPDTPEARIVFKDKYTKRGAEGHLDLHHLLQRYMLRRRKRDVFVEADPAKTLDAQPLALPRQNEVPYEVKGGFFMTWEQAELYVQALVDFDAFLDKNYPELSEVDRACIKRNKLKRYRILFDILTFPERFGLTQNPRREALKDYLRTSLLAGHKPLVWAHHQSSVREIMSVIEELSQEFKENYPNQFPDGVQFARYDGSEDAVRINPDEDMPQREIDLRRFQDKSTVEPHGMVMSYEAGGIGLTVTAGSEVYSYEQPQTFTRLIQANDRNHRTDGRYPRYAIDYIRLVAQFPPGFLDTIEDEAVREKLSRGTLDETLYKKQAQLIRQFGVVIDGVATEEDLDHRLKEDLLGDIDLKVTQAGKKKASTGYRSRKSRRIAESAENLMGMYRAYQDSDKKLAVITEIVSLFSRGNVNFEQFIELVQRLHEGEETLLALEATLSIRKKYYAQRFLRAFLPLLNTIHADRHRLHDIIRENDFLEQLIRDEGVPTQLKALVLPLLAVEPAPRSPRATINVLRNLLTIKDRAYQSYWAGRLFVALNHLNEIKIRFPDIDLLAFFKHTTGMVSEAQSREYIEALYLWSHVACNLTPRKLRQVLDQAISTGQFFGQLKQLAWKVVEEIIEVDEISGYFKNVFHDDPHRILAAFNSLNTDSAKTADASRRLIKYYQSINAGLSATEVRQQLRKGRDHVVGNPQQSRHLNKETFEKFLEAFETSHRSQYDRIQLDQGGQELLAQSMQELEQVIHDNMVHSLSERYSYELEPVVRRFVQASLADRASMREILISLKRKKLTDQLTLAEKHFLESSGLSLRAFKENLPFYSRLMDLILRWGEALSLLKDKDYDNPKLRRHLAYLISDFGVPDDDVAHVEENAFLQALQGLENCLAEWQQHKNLVLENVEIEDTNDPYLMMQLGDFHTTVSNCLAVDSAPYFLQALPLSLGSSTHRLLVAKVNNEIAAMGVVKVRVDEHGRPVIYLELSVYKGYYDFRDEFVAHLIEKVQKTQGYTPKIAVHKRLVRGLRGQTENLYGLGGFGEFEHEEAIYNVYASKKLVHEARTVYDPLTLPQGFIKPKHTMSAETRMGHYGLTKTQPSLIDPSRLKTSMPVPSIKPRASVSGSSGTCHIQQVQPEPEMNRDLMQTSLQQFGMMPGLSMPLSMGPMMMRPF